MNGNRPGVAFFVPGSGCGKQLLWLRRVFRAGTEHGGTPAALPVVLRKAGAGKRQLQIFLFSRGGLAALPDQAGIDIRNDRHILRPLHAALQLQAADAHPLHLRDAAGKTAVFQAEGIGIFRRGIEAVGQAAGLGAGTPVAAAAADEGAHLALAGIAHTQRAVAEDLDFGGAAPAGGGCVRPGTLAGDDHPLTAVPVQLVNAAAGKYAHLGAGVERKIRQRLPQQIEKPPVLHQHGIHTQTAGRPGGVQRQRQLPVCQQGVQGQKDPDAPDVAVSDGGGKFLIGEVFGAPAGVEVPPAQIHRAAAALHGGPQRLRRPGRGQKFQRHYLRLSRRC